MPKKLLPLFFMLSCILFAQDSYPYIQPLNVEYAPKEIPLATPTPQIVAPKVVPLEEPKEEIASAWAPPQEEPTSEPLDSDADGVADENDKCPDTPPNFKVDDFGCPKVITLYLYFAPNQHEITEQLMSEIEAFAAFLHASPHFDAIIYGHTDSIGDDTFNKELSTKRAMSVRDALIAKDIRPSRLSAIGKGEEQPIESNMLEEGRAKNRRIEVELVVVERQ